ncbi:MAG: ABC transporter permease [Acidobacteriota bacterium]
MRWLALFRKSVTENIRDWKVLILVLSIAPFFVFLMYFYFDSATKVYQITVLNLDKGAADRNGAAFNAGERLVEELSKVRSEQGAQIVSVRTAGDMDEARKRVNDRAADLAVIIPEDFSRVLVDYMQGKAPPPAVIKTFGDRSNASYLMAAVWADYTAYQLSSLLTGDRGPLEVQVEQSGAARSLSDFDLYVPGLLVLAFINLMFTAAGSLIREKDKGTIVRLRMSNMTPFEWLLAESTTQVIIGLGALALTYLTAYSLGYRSSGSLLALAVVGILSSLAVMAISVLVAASLRTIFDLMTVGCFPYFILMFFSGGMIPLPSLRVFTLGGRVINANDILPTTHASAAIGKILNNKAGLGDASFELGAIVFLTAVCFAAGSWMFTRRHLRPQ